MFEIIKYDEKYQDRWDKFVMESSVNGTFLHTRNFLNYHPAERFTDSSVMVMQGSNIVAVIPACDIYESGKKCFYSHKGSTFGGIVIEKNKYNISSLEEIFIRFNDYLSNNNYSKAVLRNTSNVFCTENQDLMDYYLFKEGYSRYDELSFYIDLNNSPDDLLSMLSSSHRRDFRYSLKNDLKFLKIENDYEITDFYNILCENLKRHDAAPVHTLNELLEFKNNRLNNIVDFYGVYYQNKIIAETMLFYFDNDVMHTQYLAQDTEHSDLYAMNFLIVNLMGLAKEQGFSKLSFGISTENGGKFLNKGLALFKEGFGSSYSVNKSFFKDF